jgi:hypothetical protein
VFSCILASDQFLIERAAVHTDAYRLAPGRAPTPQIVANCSSRRLPVPTVAGIDAVLVERGGALRKPGEQLMAVVVEIADERGAAAGIAHPLLDLGDRGRRFRQVTVHAHHLGTGFASSMHCRAVAAHVGRVGHRHRLHHDRGAAADEHVADAHANRLVQPNRSGHVTIPQCPSSRPGAVFP